MQVSVETLMSRARQARAARVKLAREDPAAFCNLVLKDEETGRPIMAAPVHRQWQQLVGQHRRLAIWCHTEAGKTNQLSIGRVLWELGRNPLLRVAVVSNTHGQAEKIVRSIAQYIEKSEELHQVFPQLKPSIPWSSTKLTVDRAVQSKDPSVQAFGVHGAVMGARIDLLVLDDILDHENIRTHALRQDLWNWYHSTLASRLTAQARVVCVGTAWHPDDLMHRFSRQPGWTALRFPVLDPVTGASNWPERWPLSRIEEARLERGPMEFARQMLCQAADEHEARFKREYLDAALEAGQGLRLSHALAEPPQGGWFTVTGADLGVQAKDSADPTVLFTLLISPEGQREVLWIEAGRWTGPEILERIIDSHRRFYTSAIMVENNAAQDYILQFARAEEPGIPVIPFTTGRNKAHPEYGVESLAAELSAGLWSIPNENGRVAPEVNSWMTEMLTYHPQAHTGDRLMASWFAREAARRLMRGVGGATEVAARVVG